MGVQSCPDCGEVVYGGMLQHWGGCGKHSEKAGPMEEREVSVPPVVPQVVPQASSSTKQQRWQARNPEKVRVSKRDYMRRRRKEGTEAA